MYSLQQVGTAIVNIGFNKEEAAEHLRLQSGGVEFVDVSLRQQIIAPANKNIWVFLWQVLILDDITTQFERSLHEYVLRVFNFQGHMI